MPRLFLSATVLLGPLLVACEAGARPDTADLSGVRPHRPAAAEPRAHAPRPSAGGPDRPAGPPRAGLFPDTDLLEDNDGDGVPAESDCDDTDPHTHPGAPEGCDGVDRSCDGLALPPGGVAFVHTDGRVEALTDTVGTASAAAPAHLVLDEPGALLVCPGTVYATVEVRADVELHGLGRPGAAVLDGAGAGPVVDIVGDGLEVLLAGLRIQHGAAEWGGGLSCVGDSRVSLWKLALVDNTAARGGGLYTDGCTLGGTGVELRDNAAAEDGGGGALDSGQLALEHGLLLGNHSGLHGGALALSARTGDVRTVFHDTLVAHNHSETRGGGLALQSPHKRRASAEVHCSTPDAGAWVDNDAPLGVHLSIVSHQETGVAVWVGDCTAVSDDTRTDTTTPGADAVVATAVGDALFFQLFFEMDGGMECSGALCR